jgi:hypothetical protein
MDTAMSMNEAIMGDAIARRWIVANVIVLVACAVCGFAGSGADALLALESGDVTAATTTAYWIAQIGLMVVLCAAYAMLTAPVLRSIIPALRSDLWLATHVAIGIVLGVGVALAFDGTDNREAFDLSGTSVADVAIIVLLAAVLGAIVGAVLGGIQSLVWRRVARGSLVWIGMTALSGIVVVLIIAAATPFFPGMSRLGFAVTLEGVGAAGGIVSTLIMLPALRRLQPRG